MLARGEGAGKAHVVGIHHDVAGAVQSDAESHLHWRGNGAMGLDAHLVVAGGGLGHVEPGAPRPAGAGDDDGPHVTVGLDVTGEGRHLAVHGGVHRVEPLGPVEGADGDAVGPLVLHELLLHRRELGSRVLLVRELLHGQVRSLAVLVPAVRQGWLPLARAEDIEDAPACHLEQPGLE